MATIVVPAPVIFDFSNRVPPLGGQAAGVAGDIAADRQGLAGGVGGDAAAVGGHGRGDGAVASDLVAVGHAAAAAVGDGAAGQGGVAAAGQGEGAGCGVIQGVAAEIDPMTRIAGIGQGDVGNVEVAGRVNGAGGGGVVVQVGENVAVGAEGTGVGEAGAGAAQGAAGESCRAPGPGQGHGRRGVIVQGAVDVEGAVVGEGAAGAVWSPVRQRHWCRRSRPVWTGVDPSGNAPVMFSDQSIVDGDGPCAKLVKVEPMVP